MMMKQPTGRAVGSAARASPGMLVVVAGAAAWLVGCEGPTNRLEDGGADSVPAASRWLDGPSLSLARTAASERKPSRYSRQDSLWWARDFDASVVASIEILASEPGDVRALYSLGYAEGMRGRGDAATAAFRRAVRLVPDDPNLVALAWGHARARERDAALRALGRVHGPDALLREIALVYAALGDSDRAFAWLERALERDPESLRSLDADPTADVIRSDPRFASLVKSLEAT